MDDLSSHTHRQLIGLLGMLLPILVVIIAWLRPTEVLPGTELLNSVSAYYYTGAAPVFAGLLAALATFLFTYRGYSSRTNKVDRIAACIAGGAAALTAFFPTGAPEDSLRFDWWAAWVGKAHLAFAGLLFTTFIFFALVQFRRSRRARGDLTRDKKIRNAIYLVCGCGMIGCIVWIIVNKMVLHKSIFWPEALALQFFAVSWLAKGRIDLTMRTLTSRMSTSSAGTTPPRPSPSAPSKPSQV